MEEKKQKLLDNRFVKYLFNLSEWRVFVKRFFALGVVGVVLLLVWIFPISLFVAPFYSMTTDKPATIKIYEDTVGKTTVKAVQQSIDDLVKQGLVTNFIGVNLYIDNKYYEQVGQIEMVRIAINALENNLARNRGTGGANRYLVQARADIYADYELPIFTSYTTRLKSASKNLERYTAVLQKDYKKEMNQKQAVFIVNSDNLAEVLDKLKQQLQTNIMIRQTFFTQDDKFYKLKGNLIAMEKFLKGIDKDFKDKMVDKTSYDENFIPLLKLIESSIKQNHIVISETFGHLSKLEKNVNLIAQKLGELRDKLRNG